MCIGRLRLLRSRSMLVPHACGQNTGSKKTIWKVSKSQKVVTCPLSRTGGRQGEHCCVWAWLQLKAFDWGQFYTIEFLDTCDSTPGSSFPRIHNSLRSKGAVLKWQKASDRMASAFLSKSLNSAGCQQWHLSGSFADGNTIYVVLSLFFEPVRLDFAAGCAVNNVFPVWNLLACTVECQLKYSKTMSEEDSKTDMQHLNASHLKSESFQIDECFCGFNDHAEGQASEQALLCLEGTLLAYENICFFICK